MSGHTPGPWFTIDHPTEKTVLVRGYFPNLDGKASTYTLSSVRIPDNYDVATTKGYYTPEMGAANARLIAAAPDLLAALRYLLNNCEAYEEREFPFVAPGEGSVNAALTAIAKATGTTE